MPVGFVDHRSAEDQYVEEDDERVEDGERGDLSSHQQLTINIYVQLFMCCQQSGSGWQDLAGFRRGQKWP